MFTQFGQYADFGTLLQRDVEEMKKSLTAGAGTPNTGTYAQYGGGILQFEDVAPIMAQATLQEDDLVLSQWFKSSGLTLPAAAIVAQWVKRTSQGDPVAPMFIAETTSALPSNDPAAVRLSETLKVYAKLGGYSLLAQRLNLIGDKKGDTAVDIETRSTMLALLFGWEWSGFFGNKAVDPLEFDGLVTQTLGDPDTAAMPWTSQGKYPFVWDLRGRTPSAEEVAQWVSDLSVRAPYGRPNTLFCSSTVGQYWDKLNQAKIRLASAGSIEIGNDIKGINYSGGKLLPIPSRFLEPDYFTANPLGYGGAVKPAVPVLTAGIREGSSDSAFVAADAGTYNYKIVARGPLGYSTPLQVAIAAVVAGDHGKITLNDAGVTDVTNYAVYRTAANGAVGTEQLIMRVPKNTLGATVILDENRYLPNCSSMLATRNHVDYAAFAELISPQRLMQPISILNQPFLVFGVGTPIARVRRKSAVAINVGRPDNAAIL